jgi:hypothetical protein
MQEDIYERILAKKKAIRSMILSEAFSLIFGIFWRVWGL